MRLARLTITACLVLVALSLPASSQTLVTRINCGGFAKTPQVGMTFTDDLPYVPGSSNGHVGGVTTGSLFGSDGLAIGGDSNPWRSIYEDSRVDWSAYRFELPNGDYVVRMLMAETRNQGVDLRRVSVTIEGNPVLVQVDLAAVLGVQYGGVFAHRTTVADGRLDIEASPGPGLVDPLVEGPIIQGIEIYSVPPILAQPSPPTGIVAADGYGTNLITWDWSADPLVENFVIHRADSASGPFTPIATVAADPPRYHDSSAVVGTPHFYRVTARNFDGVESDPSGVASATAHDSSESTLPVFKLTIGPAELEFISRNILSPDNQEVAATLDYEGETYAVQLRYRGSSGRLVSKKSWRLKFPADHLFRGRRDVTLKAAFLDPAIIREPLAFSLHRDLDHVVADIRAAHLEVNGRYLGVFHDIEQMEDLFLERQDRSLNANIYKCEGPLAIAPDLATYEMTYDKQYGAVAGYDDIIEFIEFLADPSPLDFHRRLLHQVDVDRYLDYLCVIGFSGDLDTIANNFYLDHDFDLGRWEIWPYDSDVNFALVPPIANLSIVAGTSLGTPGFINRLRERIITDPGLRWRYAEKMKAFVQERIAGGLFQARVAAVQSEYLVDALRDPFKFGWESGTAFSASTPFIQSWGTGRAAAVLAEANLIQPATPPTDVWINEFVAANQTTYPDEMGDFEDWIELYNASNAPVDLGGYHLTDNLLSPTKWTFPMGTIIPAQGYLVVFADQELAEGPLHAAFKLGSSGEELGLIAPDGTTVLDFISWSSQRNEVAYGRKVDGGPFFGFLATPTPGSANTTAGNLPPFVASVTRSPALPQPGDAVTIQAIVSDVEGVQSVSLFFRTNGGAFSSVPMTLVDPTFYQAQIPPRPSGSQVDYYVLAADTLGAQASKPKDAPADVLTYVVTLPVANGLRITEIVADNDNSYADELGEFDDYVEIHNESTQTIDLGGMYLTDNLGNPTKWQIPAGTSIPADGRLIFWADSSPTEGPRHASFSLSAGGESIGLFATDGSTLIDGFSFSQQLTDVAHARLPDDGALRFRMVPSPAARNRPLEGHVAAYNAAAASQNALIFEAAHALEIGYPFGTILSNGSPLAQGYIIFDLSTLSMSFGTEGTLLVTPIPEMTQFFMTDAFGQGSWSALVPNLPALVGFSVYFQAYVVGSGLSNGLVGTIGQQGIAGPTDP